MNYQLVVAPVHTSQHRIGPDQTSHTSSETISLFPASFGAYFHEQPVQTGPFLAAVSSSPLGIARCNAPSSSWWHTAKPRRRRRHLSWQPASAPEHRNHRRTGVASSDTRYRVGSYRQLCTTSQHLPILEHPKYHGRDMPGFHVRKDIAVQGVKLRRMRRL